MNVQIANKLVNLRKSLGLSQEELAHKIGVSRQAVSKWERAESSPDTDNLIALSQIYKISIDELLDADIEIAQKELDSQKSTKHLENKQNAYATISALLAVIIFLVTGLLYGAWYFNWVVFLLIPIFYYIPVLGKGRDDY